MVRLFVIPAKQESVAVIFRRGPSRWCHVIQWDTRHDRFEHGAWIKGRIYEDKCDISPDGRLLVCFVMKGNRFGSQFKGAWTAVSRTPWLRALIVWPQGTTYGGGGRFVDNRTLALRGVTYPPIKEFPLRGLCAVHAYTEPHVSTKEVPGTDWCGRDHAGRLIFTRGGQLFRRVKANDILIADFTDLVPNPQPAPEWAGLPL